MKKVLALLIPCFTACEDPAIPTPNYVVVNSFELATDYPTQGTRSSKITTVWAYRNQELIGVFELPVRFPIVGRGQQSISLYPGVNLNGMSSTRALNPFWEPYTFQVTLGDGQADLNPGSNGTVPTTYNAQAQFDLVENFDGVGLNMADANATDTFLYRTNNPAERFPSPAPETNVFSGKVVMPKKASLFEIVTTNTYSNWPKGGAPVYFEMDYKTEIPLVVGVYVNTPGQTFQTPLVQINANDQWNKIYIDMAPEINYPGATDYSIFIGGVKGATTNNPVVLLDNIKVVY
jgi:hypothetical protein